MPLFQSFSDISSQLPVFSPISVELYQKMDHWLYPLIMPGIFIVFHAVRAGLRCAVATVDSNFCYVLLLLLLLLLLCTVMSQTPPLSCNVFLPFLTFVESHQQWSNQFQITKPTDELFITAYPCPDWVTAPFLTIASYFSQTCCAIMLVVMNFGKCSISWYFYYISTKFVF